MLLQLRAQPQPVSDYLPTPLRLGWLRCAQTHLLFGDQFFTTKYKMLALVHNYQPKTTQMAQMLSDAPPPL